MFDKILVSAPTISLNEPSKDISLKLSKNISRIWINNQISIRESRVSTL